LWAWEDLNLRPHPYQVSRAKRCADRRFPRSPVSVRGEGMRSNGKPRSEWARARLGHALSPRADRTLASMPGCTSCGADIPEGFAFCGRCGAPLPSAPEAEERRVVTVLFCDLAGFTARSDHADPEDVWALLRPYHALLRRQIERFGGTLDKFIGDGVMAVFGIPVAHEDDPERAVRCGAPWPYWTGSRS
jgi:hypothetical protein